MTKSHWQIFSHVRVNVFSIKHYKYNKLVNMSMFSPLNITNITNLPLLAAFNSQFFVGCCELELGGRLPYSLQSFPNRHFPFNVSNSYPTFNNSYFVSFLSMHSLTEILINKSSDLVLPNFFHVVLSFWMFRREFLPQSRCHFAII